jgi:hypothetical protein
MRLACAQPTGVVGAELGVGTVGGAAVGDDLVAAGVVGLGVDASAVTVPVRAHGRSFTPDRRVLSCLTEALTVTVELLAHADLGSAGRRGPGPEREGARRPPPARRVSPATPPGPG